MATRVTITCRGVFHGRTGELSSVGKGQQFRTVYLDGEPYRRPDGTTTKAMAFGPSEYTITSPRAQRTT